jgi:hypothetical protein
MKTIFFFIFLFVFIAGNAQTIPDKISANLYPTDSLPNSNYAFNVPGAKLLFETEKGKIYELPLDKMRCLEPSFTSNMPVYRGFPGNESQIYVVPIPNPLLKQNRSNVPQVQTLPLPRR